MTGDFKNQLSGLVDRIKDLDAREIILFGSYAANVADSDSDIDLCILVNKNGKRKIDYLREVRKAIAPILTHPIDLLVYDKVEFYERANLQSSLEFQIKNNGIKLYEQ